MTLKQWLKRVIPYKSVYMARKVFYFGWKYNCSVCGSSTRARRPQGYGHPVLERLQVVGGMYKENDVCPICHANDRDRLVAFYLERRVQRSTLEGKSLLHVAPEKGLSKMFRDSFEVDYIAGDLEPNRYWHLKNLCQLDLLKLPFADGSVDFVICNHVLEHIVDDVGAMAEIRRILAQNGLAILQTPISLRLPRTCEGNGEESESERIALYGQKDHVRIYTLSDYISRLTSAGFSVECYRAFDDDASEATDLRLNPFEILFVCRPRTAGREADEPGGISPA